MIGASFLSVDHIIVYVFLLLTLVAGLWVGRGIKDIKEYAIGNRMYGVSVLVFTYLATNMAGSFVLSNAGLAFSDGIVAIYAFFGFFIAEITCALFIAPQIIKFSDCYTMGDLMAKLYGKYSGILAGTLGVLQAITITGMELVALGIVCKSLLDINPVWGIMVGGLVLTIYSAHGGIKAVVTTDVIQFLTLIVSIPIIAYIAVKQAGGVNAVFTQVPAKNLSVFSHEKFYYYLSCFLAWGIFPSGLIDPAIMQRMLMGRNARELRKQFFITAVVNPSVNTIIMLIGLAGLLIYPSIEANDVVPRIMNEILPVGIRGFTIAGLLALIMSTADSYLHIAGLGFVHDVIRPLWGNRWPDFAKKECQWARVATLLLGLGAIAIGLHATSMFELFLDSLAFMGPILMFPLLSGVMGLKPDRRAFYIATLTTILVWVTAEVWLPEQYSSWSLLMSIIANGITFFGTHYVLNRGFRLSKPREDRDTIFHQPKQSLRWENLAPYLPTFKNIVRYSQNRVKKYGAPYILAGIFCLFNLIVPHFLWQGASSHRDLLLNLRFVGATCCGLLIIKDKWTQGFHQHMPFFFHLTLLYCLPFFSTIMSLATQGDVAWLTNLALSTLMLMVLVDSLSVLLISTLGILIGIFFYAYFIAPIHLIFQVTSSSLILYQCTVGIFIGLLFALRKQNRFENLTIQKARLALDNQEVLEELLLATDEKIRFVNTLKRAGITQLSSAAQISKQLLAASKKEDVNNKPIAQLAQQLHDQISPIAFQLDKLEHRVINYLSLDGTKEVQINTLLQNMQQALQTKGYKPKIVLHTQYQEVQCDVEKMQKVILNSFAFIHSITGAPVSILLGVEDTQLRYSIRTIKENHKKRIPALRFTITTANRLPTLQEGYSSQVNEAMHTIPESTRELPLLTNERIIKAHYGYMQTINQGGFLTLFYIIPVNIRDVRSKDMDRHQMILGTDWPRADDAYPGAQEQEQRFLKKVKEKSQANIKLIEKAIGLIKDYHGPIRRKSGEPFYLHPITTAQIVLDYNQEEATIIAALLHDIVEDTPLTFEQIELLFDEEVRSIVAGVTHIESTQETIHKVLLSQPENIHKLLLEEDKRVLYVKLADRMHNMRTIQAKSHESQRKTAEETLLFFVPLAKYLGLVEAAEELRMISFGVLGNEIKV